MVKWRQMRMILILIKKSALKNRPWTTGARCARFCKQKPPGGHWRREKLIFVHANENHSQMNNHAGRRVIPTKQ